MPFGDAGFFGDVSDLALNRPVIGSVATPSGQGYYLFASDGGIFTFGDAAFFGSTGDHAVEPAGGGHGRRSGRVATGWSAPTAGCSPSAAPASTGRWGPCRLNRPVSAVVPGQAGYLMVGEDGGAFSFGDVAFFGSLGGRPPATPVVSVALRA